MTFEKYISDIELRLSGGKPADDLEISRAHIAYLLSVTRDNMVIQHLTDIIKKGGEVPAFYLERQSCEEMQIEDLECLDDCKDYVYVDLDATPLNLPNDLGIQRVETSDGEDVYRSSMINVGIFRKMKFTKATPDNLWWYRKGKRVYIEGISKKTLDVSKLIIWYIRSYAENQPLESEEFLISPELADAMLERTFQILAGQAPQDITNEAIDNVKFSQS